MAAARPAARIGRRSVEHLENADNGGASERGAHQIDGIDQPDRKRTARQREAHRDSGEDVRRGHDGHQQRHAQQRRERRHQRRDQGELHRHRCRHRYRGEQRCVRQPGGEIVGRHAVASQVDPDGAGRHAQHRDADRKEGDVVPRDDRQDARLDDLKDEHGERDEEHAAEKLRAPKLHEPALRYQAEGPLPGALALDYFCNDASVDDRRPGLWHALHVTLVVAALAGFAFHCCAVASYGVPFISVSMRSRCWAISSVRPVR